MSKLMLPIGILGLMTFVAAKPPSEHVGRTTGFERGNGGGSIGIRGEAELTGQEEVPANDSNAAGEFAIRFDCEFTKARFKLEVEADDVLQAHLHCGSAGENGPVVVFLFGLFPGGVDVDGELASLTLTKSNLDAVNADCSNAIGYQIETLEDLANAMAAGDVYVNVHTVAFPGGEIRGQVEINERRSRCGNGNDNDNENNNEDDDDGEDGDNGDHGH